MKTVRQESPVDKLTGAITTPPRKKSFGMTGSPSHVHRSDPFSIQNVNLKEEVKIKRDQINDSEDYEEEVEESEDEENEEEEEKVVKSNQKTAAPPIKAKNSGTKMPVPPPVKQPIDAISDKTDQKSSLQATKPPPMMKQRIPPQVNSKDSKPQDRRRDLPPMKTRTDFKDNEDESMQEQIKIENPIPDNSIADTNKTSQDLNIKDQNENRSKTPQPIQDKTKTLEQQRSSRFSRETDEPSVTHAVVRDKSIGERIRSTLLPGFLGGGSASTLAVETATEPQTKQTDNSVSQKPSVKDEKNDSIGKPPLPQKEAKQEGAFEGLFNSVLKLLGRKKKESKQAFMGSSGAGLVYDKIKKKYIIPGEENESEDDIPPPPISIKKKEENKEGNKDLKPKGGKGRLAVRYAQTFDTNQILAEAPDESKIDEKPFAPPSFDSIFNQPPSFEFQPEESNSPKILPATKHSEKQLESVRQDHLSMPKFEDDHGRSKIDEEYVNYNELENENRIETENQSDNNENADNIVTNENYEKAYNQLQNYKSENKVLKREIMLNQAKAEMNIDYFVQLWEDVKYRGMEELESLKNTIEILQGEKKKFISKQAQHLALINKLEFDIKLLQKKNYPINTDKPYKTPQEAKEKLSNGLEELKCFQAILEKFHYSQCTVKKKDEEIKNILFELLNNIFF